MCTRAYAQSVKFGAVCTVVIELSISLSTPNTWLKDMIIFLEQHQFTSMNSWWGRGGVGGGGGEEIVCVH